MLIQTYYSRYLWVSSYVLLVGSRVQESRFFSRTPTGTHRHASLMGPVPASLHSKPQGASSSLDIQGTNAKTRYNTLQSLGCYKTCRSM